MDNQDQSLTKRQRRELRKQEKVIEKESQARRKSITKWFIIVLILVLAGGLGYFVVGASSSDNNSQNVNVASGTDINSGNNPYLGGENASVVITEFTDFSCSACAAAAPLAKQLHKEYGNQIKVVFNSFNLRYQWSAKSLEAGECAFQQGKFWEYYDLIFLRQSEWVRADDALDKFKLYAQQLGLNEKAFSACLDSGRMAGEVARDTNVAQSEKITATPTFDINGQKLVGVKPITEFKKIIDEELNK